MQIGCSRLTLEVCPGRAELADRGDPVAVKAAVQEIVRRQRETGVDIVNDGEVSKPSYATYVTERLTGFEGEPIPVRFKGRAVKDFPEFYEKQWPEFATLAEHPTVDPRITWAKLAAMAEGAGLASAYLWGVTV